MSLKSGHKIVPLSPSNAELDKLFIGRKGTVQVEPGPYVFLKAFEKYANDFYEFEWDETDVAVLTVPKSGTTWIREIVWTMRNNPSLESTKGNLPLIIRCPAIETDIMIDHCPQPESFKALFSEHFPDFDQSYGMFLHLSKTSGKPRTLKSHLPFSLLSSSMLEMGKVVYTIRDPRDVCISYHHHCRLFNYDNFKGTFDQFVDAFINGAILMGSYWPHIREAWSRRHHPNMHIVYYEKLKKNPKAEIQRLNDFLGTKLSDEQIDKIVHYTSFAEMKKRDNHVVSSDDAPNFMNMAMVKEEGGFFREGMSGGWKKVMSQEQKDMFEAWIAKNCPDKEIMNNILNP